MNINNLTEKQLIETGFIKEFDDCDEEYFFSLHIYENNEIIIEPSEDEKNLIVSLNGDWILDNIKTKKDLLNLIKLLKNK